MKVSFPQIDLPRGISGGRDAWDDNSAGVILIDEYFGLERIENVIDDFNDNSLDLAKWYTYLNAATVTETGQRIEIALTPNTVGAEGDLISLGDFSLRNSSVFVSFLQAATPGVDSLFIVQSVPGDRLMWLLTATTARAYVQTGYSTISSGSSIGITPGASLSFRIREELGRVYFDYSINAGATWTNSHSEAVSNIPWQIGDISALVAAYEFSGTGATTQSTSVFDNFNAIPGGGSFSQSCTETIVLNDSSFRTPSKRLIDALVLVDTVRKTPSRTLIDAFTLVDTVRRTTTRTLTDSIALVDTFAGKITARLLSEAISLVDTVSKTTSRTITEAISLVDTIIRTTTRRLTEVITLQDVFAGVKITTKALVETLVLVDTMAKTTSRRLTDAVTMADTVIRTTTKRLIDSLSLQDSFSFSRSLSRVYSETLTLADSIAKTTSKVIRETLSLIDTFLGETISIVVRSIGNWIVYGLGGLMKIVKGENKAHTLSTSKEVHVVLLSERSFTVSPTEISHTTRSNTTP